MSNFSVLNCEDKSKNISFCLNVSIKQLHLKKVKEISSTWGPAGETLDSADLLTSSGSSSWDKERPSQLVNGAVHGTNTPGPDSICSGLQV